MKKTKKSRNTVKENVAVNGLSVKNPNSAGIDLGSKDHWVAVSPHLAKDRIKRFPTYTCNLHDISNWLKKCNVDSIAMESTGIYWIPLYELLEKDGFDVNLCNAQHVKNLPGRQKTDAKDCAWIQKLHSFGLLTASFVPKLDILALRTLMRYRERLQSENSRHVLRMQKILTQMNVLLPNVLSDITGKTGTDIMKAIISGKTDPEYLIQFKNKQVKASDEIFLKALNGNYQYFYINILSYELMHYEYFEEEIEKIDNEVSALLTRMIKSENDDYDECITLSEAEQLIVLTGVDLTQVPGFEILSIRKLIGETGIDMSKWKMLNISLVG
ncbi:MAG: IS110 family transposase [Candidatus Cloacimonetes bacterium]|nr:IS110 family transposase [Candidatus Cloacimonadota bacterium]